jgi:hypothetical protein
VLKLIAEKPGNMNSANHKMIRVPQWSKALVETQTVCQGSEDITHTLWNPEVQYCVHESIPPAPNLSRTITMLEAFRDNSRF